ncbi:hypothetical protein EQ871_15095 [Enterococcus casseliflavus]|jgi:hypothetical protein|uniref:hypothetical protein n=1 Tax=Enterococcus casseliflavus TaxID=37734 RepID=UPI000FFC6B72|nr:hypothetical protein [Enterococcus casseliflavus]RXA59938.1 hypothetical protein EQ871_15095 [Enterococcus casseliflavus]
MTEKSLFRSRLEAYFEANKIENVGLKNAIIQRLGSPQGTVSEILNLIDNETQEYTYDIAFERILDSYSTIFHMKNALSLFESICGYYGTDILFVTDDLQGIAIRTL